MAKPDWRISSTRRPDCPFWYQREVVLGFETESIYGEEWRLMGEIGHKLCGLYIDWLSAQIPQLKAKHSYFNHLCHKHVPKDFYSWVRQDLDDVLEQFMWQFSLDIRADAHLTEINLAYKRGTYEPCDPEEKCDRITFKPDYIRIYNDGKKAAIDDWKLGYMQFDYDEVRPPIQPGQPPSRVCVQLATYANGWMKLHPECEEVTVTVIGPRWGKANISTHTWTRELVAEFVDEMYEQYFQKLDIIYDACGDNDWPAIAYWPSCKYCGRCGSPVLPAIFEDPITLAAADKLRAMRCKKADKAILTKLSQPVHRELVTRLMANKIKTYPAMRNPYG